MKITIFGATGGVGSECLRLAMEAGHEVTVVVRDAARLSLDPHHVMVADLRIAPDAKELIVACEGAGAVLSCVGPRSPQHDRGVVTAATRVIVAAMHAAHARRILIVSAAPVSTIPTPGNPDAPRHDPGEGFFARHVLTPIVKRALPSVCADLSAAEDVLRESGLDWTAVRPPRLTDKPGTGRYRTAPDRNLRGGLSIPRADLAAAMLAMATQPSTVGHAMGVAT
ncbi:NAD(P)-dependent oxidoreductase [Herbidospora daliensis]|uniref:NAD(P)-dependent oxidoreductase n=1 Tax=Herbidospora daliensis TaxID=295585 RepID=UPI0007803BBE|nr:NAD(P)H-binding protein [Herbidospora daliensis]